MLIFQNQIVAYQVVFMKAFIFQSLKFHYISPTCSPSPVTRGDFLQRIESRISWFKSTRCYTLQYTKICNFLFTSTWPPEEKKLNYQGLSENRTISGWPANFDIHFPGIFQVFPGDFSSFFRYFHWEVRSTRTHLLAKKDLKYKIKVQ